MVIDRTGFLWTSTNDGLNRFDGYEFKIFRYDQDDSTSIPTTGISKIFYDQEQHLWLYSSNDIVPFNIESGKTIRKNIVRAAQFQSICLATESYLWGYTVQQQLILINKNNFKSHRKSKINRLISNNERIIGSFSNGINVYVISDIGAVYTYNTTLNSWKKSSTNGQLETVKYNATAFNAKSVIYIGSMENDMLEYDILQNTFKTSHAHEAGDMLVGINYLYFDSSTNELLISAYGQGVFSYNETTKHLTHFKQGDPDLSLTSNYSLTVLKDKNKNLFIGYDGKGLDILDANLKKFVALRKDNPKDKHDLKFVRRIVEDKQGNIWFGSSGSGLIEYQRSNDAYTIYNKGLLAPTPETFILESVIINNEIWLGLSGGDIIIFNIDQKKVTRKISLNKASAEDDGIVVWSMAYDEVQDKIWVGTDEHGIYLIDRKTKTIKTYYDESKDLFKENKINCFYTSRSGDFLVGSLRGILIYDKKTDRFKQKYPKENTSMDMHHSIRCIYQDINNNLWLGTDGAGISILNDTFEIIRSISTKDKLNNNVIYGILSENNHSLWVSSNLGLSNIKWNKGNITKEETFHIYNYESASGLQSNEFNTNSYIKLSDGALGFGGLNGINIFYGNDIKTSNTAPPVIITDFSVFNKKINENKLIPYISDVNLAFNQNSFSLRFNTVGLAVTDKIKYQYRLKGHDPEWVYSDKRTYVSYTNLSPGNYEFQVRASNYDGYWSSEFTSLRIRIASPIYMRWWFILGIIGLSTIIIWSFARNKSLERTARENLKLAYTKEIAEVEMKALRAQINPHFLFNSLNSINNFILKNENTKARKYLVKFSQLVRNILNNSTGPYISLKDEIDTINLYVQIESMRFDNQFNFSLEVEDNLRVGEINIPSLLLQPYIENAIWHGLLHKEGQKSIGIRIFRKDQQSIHITIEDNGIGRKMARVLSSKEPRRKSYGMQLGANRLKLMNSENQSKGDVEVIDLYNDQQKPIGTKIIITLPISPLKKSLYKTKLRS